MANESNINLMKYILNKLSHNIDKDYLINELITIIKEDDFEKFRLFYNKYRHLIDGADKEQLLDQVPRTHKTNKMDFINFLNTN